MSARHWIVWLMLAMLPLRGWAVATMEMPTAVADGAGFEFSSPINTHDRAPCHDAAADDDQGATAHTCGLCDLCHNAVAAAAVFDASAPTAPEALPPPGAARDTGRQAIGGLERPPRTSSS